MLGRNYKPYYQIRDKYPSYITNLQNSKTRTPISKQAKKVLENEDIGSREKTQLTQQAENRVSVVHRKGTYRQKCNFRKQYVGFENG